MLILGIAVLSTFIIAIQPARVRALAQEVQLWAVVLAVFGVVAQSVGLQFGGLAGHALLATGMAALVAAAWSLRRWPGGTLFVIGVALNALVMSVYGRMPIPPDVIERLQLSYSVGTILAGSKDVVANGWLASWLGDRFIMPIPVVNRTIVWSLGDLVMLAGVVRAATARIPDAKVSRTAQSGV